MVGNKGRITVISRRQLVQGAGALLLDAALIPIPSMAQSRGVSRNDAVEYGRESLPAGIRARLIDTHGLRMHILEAGFDEPGRACIVLLHGFPELAYTWRNQLLPLARTGFHVIAPDFRGYGRTAPHPVAFDDDLAPYVLLNRVSDVIGLIRALGFDQVACVVGHDWGGPTAAWCALVRPDIFRSVAFMSTPFDGPPELPLGSADHPSAKSPRVDLSRELAALSRPRKYYRTYLSTRGANQDLWHAPQGVHDLLRAWFYFKSADWRGNKPFPLKLWAASELAKMPEYYVLDLHKTIAQTMAEHMPSQAQIAACTWMSEDLEVYRSEYVRTGFQGGLNSYRLLASARYESELNSFTGRTIDVPSCYIAGASEWGIYQSPGAFETMQKSACTRLLGVHLVPGAGQSVAEEQPDEVNRVLIQFLEQAKREAAG
jgi:pimeloyl-ACP methyl ester carboxylesterase